MNSMETNGNRFVVLFHHYAPGQGRSDHWDLMLEEGLNLITWALVDRPLSGCTIAAVRLDNHRSIYLDFEGKVSGDRGWVKRIASGNYCWNQESGRRIARMWGKDEQEHLDISWDVMFDPVDAAIGQPVGLSFAEATGTP